MENPLSQNLLFLVMADISPTGPQSVNTSNTSSASGGSLTNRSLLSRWWRESVMGSTKFWISSMNSLVKTVPLHGRMLSQLSLRGLAILLIAMVGRDNHSQFQSFN